MQQPGRIYSAGDQYRYGFNGKEKDSQMYGIGNGYDYGDRIYNPRIGTWLSVDPLQKKHPNESPYLYTGGNPILFADPDGRDRIITIKLITDKGEYTLLQIRTDIGVYKKTMYALYIWGQVKVEKENYTETYTIDVSKRTPTYNPPLISHTTSTEFVSTYTTNIVSYGLDKVAGQPDLNDPNAKAIPQNFGFVEVGGNGTTIELGGSDAKHKEILDLSGILGAANAVKDLGEGFPNLIDLLKKVKGVSPLTKALLLEAEQHEKVASAADALDAASSQNSNQNNKFKRNSTVCSICGNEPHGLDDYITDDSGNPVKKIVHNPSYYDPKTKQLKPAKNDTIPVKKP